MTRLRLWLGPLLLLCFSLGVAELMLHLVASRSRRLDALLTPAWSMLPYVSDSALAWRGNPRWPDHDAWGFRNPDTVAAADIVTLGDSHTYGTGVDRSESWPSVLGQHRSVYNMAFGGWGPAQAQLLIGQALQLKPHTVIFALYFGNDFFDAFTIARQRRGLRHFLPAELIDSSEALERRDPLGKRADRLFAMNDSLTSFTGGDPPAGLRRWLSEHSRLYGVARALRGMASGTRPGPALLSRNLDRTLARLTEEQRRTMVVYRGSEWRGLLTPSYRNLVIDDRDIRVQAGTAATLAMMASMDSSCRRHGARLVVLLLPTKESVFGPRVPAAERPPALDSVIQNEQRLRDEVTTYLSERHIGTIDPLPDLRASQAQPYFEDADGHPNRDGHRLIAEVVDRRLTELSKTPQVAAGSDASTAARRSAQRSIRSKVAANTAASRPYGSEMARLAMGAGSRSPSSSVRPGGAPHS